MDFPRFKIINWSAIGLLFWGRAILLAVLCITGWLWWMTGIDRVVFGDMDEGCYLDGNRTKPVTTAQPVTLLGGGHTQAIAGQTMEPPHANDPDIAKGSKVVFVYLAGSPAGDLSKGNKALPDGSCALLFDSSEFSPQVVSAYESGGRVWLVDCCGEDDPATNPDPESGITVREDWSLYQAPADGPDWTDETTWPEAFPPAQWGWDTEFEGLPAQRLRSGAMGDVVVALGGLTFFLMFVVSVALVWREVSGWPAERSMRL